MNNLRKIRKRRGLSQTALGDKLGTTGVTVSRYEEQDQKLTLPLLRRLAEVLECSINEIIGEVDPLDTGDRVEVPEYDVRVSAGGGFLVEKETLKDVWPFSRQYLTNELRLSPSKLVILEVQGDSMEPTLHSADRVLVDMNDTNPAQPGIFVLWDSDRTVVKRVEKIPGSSPVKLLLISDNKLHNDYEVLGEETMFIGRVVWFARRM